MNALNSAMALVNESVCSSQVGNSSLYFRFISNSNVGCPLSSLVQSIIYLPQTGHGQYYASNSYTKHLIKGSSKVTVDISRVGTTLRII